MRRLTLLASLIFSLTLVSCDGEKGDTGPQGPSGNANVDVSEYNIQPSDWQENGLPSGQLGYGYYVSLICPSISLDIMNNGGLVQVYIQGNGNSNWWPLPLTTPVGTNQSGDGWQSNFTFTYELSTMYIETWDDDGLTLSPSSPIRARVVTATSNKISQDEIDRLLSMEIEDIQDTGKFKNYDVLR